MGLRSLVNLIEARFQITVNFAADCELALRIWPDERFVASNWAVFGVPDPVMSYDGRLLCRLWFPWRWICSFLGPSLSFPFLHSHPFVVLRRLGFICLSNPPCSPYCITLYESMADLSLLVNLASVEFVSSTNQSLLGFNRSGGSPVWAPQNVGSLAFPKHLGSFLGISLPFCMHSYWISLSV